MRIDNAGRVLVGTSTANTSGAKLQTSDGITFPATQVASADPNTLDDYEEGTFTPTIVSETGSFTSITYDGNRGGKYTKIGNYVVAQIFMATQGVTVGTASGKVLIDGFPFTPSSSARCSGALINVFGYASSNAPEAIGNILSDVYLFKRTTAGSSQAYLQVSDLLTGANSNSFHATFVYFL